MLKPTSIKNPQPNALQEHVHQVTMEMLCSCDKYMANLVPASGIDTFLTNVVYAIHSPYHRVLKASSEAAIFRQEMPFNIPFLADLNKKGGYV